MKTLSSKIILGIILLLSIVSNAYSQISGAATMNGAFLNKIVNYSSVQTGVNIVYTIQFSIPAGSTNVVITDNLPNTVEFVQLVTSSICGTPTITQPAVGNMGGTVTYSLANVPTACSGTFQIVVRFPAGTTCNGTVARNLVCMDGLNKITGDFRFCTKEPVSTTAIATDPWIIQKNPLNTFYTGSSACGYSTTKDTVEYEIKVAKSVGIYGYLNLNNGVVTDATGGTIVASSITTTAGTAIATGGTLTWTLPSLMSATVASNVASVKFKVYYPGWLSGTQQTNTANLTGSLGQPSCQVNINKNSNTTCVVKNTPPPPSGSLFKSVWVGGHSVGCQGYYDITVLNNGSSPFGSFAWNDPMPTGVTVTSIQVWNASATSPCVLSVNGTPGSTITTSPFTFTPGGTVSTIGLSQTGTLNVGAQIRVRIFFNINASAPSTVTNTVSMVTPTPITPTSRSVSFGVYAPAPQACTYKTICNPKPNNIYNQGDILRYRLRVQNIGSDNMTNAIITDVLSNNLEYYGSPYSYQSSNNNPACGTSNTPAWLSNPIPNIVGNTLTWNNINIPANCQSVLWPNCGYWGTSGLPFYFIEFDVRVRDTAGLGNIINNFSLGNGNLPTVSTSPNTYITVVGTHGFMLDKSVSVDGGTTYSTAETSTNGSNVNYLLKLNNTGTASFRNITMIDLLPRDNGTSDNFILNRTASRGSQFDIAYTGFVSSAPFVPVATLFSAGINLCVPEFGYSPSGCNTSSWIASAPPSLNAKLNFGTNYLAAGNTLKYIFKAGISNASATQKACNTFAAAATGIYILNNVNTPIPLLATESNMACVEIKKDDCQGYIKGGEDKYCSNTPITLTAVGSSPCPSGFSYLWSTGETTQSIVVSASSTTTYYCTITCNDKEGCSVVVSTTIYIIDGPKVNLISQCVKCDGEKPIVSIDIEATGGNPGYSFEWNNGSTSEDLIDVTDGFGTYCVTVTDKNGCTTERCFDCMNPCKANVKRASSPIKLKDKAFSPNSNKNFNFTVYPNPFKDEVLLNLSANQSSKGAENGLNVKIFNSIGQLVKTQKITTQSSLQNIDTSALSSGIYNFTIENESSIIWSSKLIKQ